jgi:hypothetical protein
LFTKEATAWSTMTSFCLWYFKWASYWLTMFRDECAYLFVSHPPVHVSLSNGQQKERSVKNR